MNLSLGWCFALDRLKSRLGDIPIRFRSSQFQLGRCPALVESIDHFQLFVPVAENEPSAELRIFLVSTRVTLDPKGLKGQAILSAQPLAAVFD